MATTAPNNERLKDASSASTFTPATQLTILLVLVARKWRSLLDEKLRPTGQSSARMEALSAILNSPDGSAQVDIARRLRIEGPTLTRMLDALEKDGLVERQPAPGDRRTKRLQVTPEGEAALADIFAMAEVFRGRLLEGVSAETLAEVTGFLSGLLERLDAGLLGGLPGDDAPRSLDRGSRAST